MKSKPVFVSVDVTEGHKPISTEWELLKIWNPTRKKLLFVRETTLEELLRQMPVDNIPTKGEIEDEARKFSLNYQKRSGGHSTSLQKSYYDFADGANRMLDQLLPHLAEAQQTIKQLQEEKTKAVDLLFRVMQAEYISNVGIDHEINEFLKSLPSNLRLR